MINSSSKNLQSVGLPGYSFPVATLEGGRDYRPGGGLDFHNSPLMAEIPAGDYSHLHRSIDQLRSMNERGIIGPLGTSLATTDLRFVHEYKPVISLSDMRNNNVNERLEYITAKAMIDNNRGGGSAGSDGHSAGSNNNSSEQQDLRQHVDHQDQKPYNLNSNNNNNNSAPSTPPTPLSISEAQMNDTKVIIIGAYYTQCEWAYIKFKWGARG